MTPIAQAWIVVAALLLWLVPLLRMRRLNRARTVKTVDLRARWGVLLEAAGYTVIWQSDFWNHELVLWRAALSIALLTVAVVVSFLAARALGSQLRIDASLSDDHKLTRTGPYGWVRHPVYASFLCLIVGSGLMIASWTLLLIGVAIFLCGTEIRVRVEDALLAARFGDEFAEYRRQVPAYLPGVR